MRIGKSDLGLFMDIVTGNKSIEFSMQDIKEQKDKIWEKEWNNLLILDACRFDFFQAFYREFMEGKLERVVSAGSSTPEWVREVFGGDSRSKDIVYISGNPFINSKGIEVAVDVKCDSIFHKVCDVWKDGWSDEKETVPPEEVAKSARKSRAKYPGKRMIVHFMQPHYPYLGLESVKEKLSDLAGQAETKYDFLTKIKRNLQKALIRSLNQGNIGTILRNLFQIRGIFNLKSDVEPKLVAKKYGFKALVKGYIRNLKIVLKECAKLASRLPGSSVITSDHGELLGEDGLYGHETYFNHPILRIVPWFEIRST